jgi:hypothetical protein
MDADASTRDTPETEEERADAEVRVHESRPGRVVFTEADNSDAWIATDLTVEPEQ